MARHVKISSLGFNAPSYPSEGDADFKTLIPRMIRYWKERIDEVLPDRPDLIVLPENYDFYGETPHEKSMPYRRALGQEMLEAMRRTARENQCYIVHASTMEGDDGLWRNSAYMIDRKGEVVGSYHKNYLPFGEEESGVVHGKEASLIQCDFGSVGMAICFDLNFEELRQRYEKLRPDLILFPSMYHGGLMQAYWAYACRAHFVGCVGIRNVPNEIYSPVGHKLAASTNYYQSITHTINLDCAVAHLDQNVEKFFALKRKYGARVTIFDPGLVGSVLISSEHPTLGVDDMIREFGIIPLEDYWSQSLNERHASISGSDDD